MDLLIFAFIVATFSTFTLILRDKWLPNFEVCEFCYTFWFGMFFGCVAFHFTGAWMFLLTGLISSILSLKLYQV